MNENRPETTRTTKIERRWELGVCYGSVQAAVALVQKGPGKPVVETSISYNFNTTEAEHGAVVIARTQDAIEWCLAEKERFEKVA